MPKEIALVSKHESDQDLDPDVISMAQGMGLPKEALNNPHVVDYLKVVVETERLQKRATVKHAELMRSFLEGTEQGVSEGMLEGLASADLLMRATSAILKDPTNKNGIGDFVATKTRIATSKYTKKLNGQ